jgi:hypothetical protein
MPFWKRKPRNTGTAPLTDADLATRIADLPDQAAPPRAMRAGTPLLKLLPIADIIKGITGVLRDPNGKISSKRAGAGALVAAGITFLAEDKMPAGITCLVAAICLFVLTKWDNAPQ